MNLLLLILICFGVASAFGADDFTSADCTWQYFDQPLSHFEKSNSGYYKQRLCVYSKFWEKDKSLPVFLYTGNESPVEEYVNNTGLMWNLAKKFNALVIFAEHRYFGESIPEVNGVDNCISYLNSEEALADYATLSNHLRREWGAQDSAIIAFGGSYGGMLASWLRVLYPSAVDGAIAASAPVWGFPLNTCPLDGSARVVSYAVSSSAGAADLCATNLKAAYVLLSDIASSDSGRQSLSTGMGLCSPLGSAADVSTLLEYLQAPLFNLAEGSFPFPSSYITFALTGSDAPLPPWAMQVMCEPLGKDFGAKLSGDPSAVKFSVSIGNVTVEVDWDKTSGNGYSTADANSSGAMDLLRALAGSSQVWYNVSGSAPSCIDWASAPQTVRGGRVLGGSKFTRGEKVPPKQGLQSDVASTSASRKCTATKDDITPGNAWNILTCNEGLNLVNWWVQGVGNDVYWPPNQPKGFSRKSMVPGSLDYCVYLQSEGLYGIPLKRDDWSFWLDTAYGGERMQYASNIVFSNGNLDPWSPAGVTTDSNYFDEAQSIVSVSIDMGGHHLDLFWPTEQDPQSVRDVRDLEEKMISRWIQTKGQANARRSKVVASLA